MTSLAGSATRLGPGPADYLDSTEGQLRPFFTLPDYNDNKKVLDLLKIYINVCENYYRDYFSVQQDNVLIYKGIQWLNQDRSSNRFLDRNGVVTRRSPKVVINNLADLTEQWVSKYTRFRPAVQINPASTEYSDKDDARVSKMVLDNIWYKENIDLINQTFARTNKICGEAYCWIEWDPNKGPVHPAMMEARRNGQRIPRIDENGNPVLGSSGDPLFIEQAVRIGDVKYSLDAPWHTLDQPCRNRSDIDWSIRWRMIDTDYLKAKYPDKANEIRTTSTHDFNSIYRLDIGQLRNETIQYELFHRSTEFVEKGRYIRFTKDVILENIDLPYSHGEIPYIYMPDIEVPDEIRGMSFFQQIFPLQFQLNACASLIYKGLVLFAHPKIAMPDGACEITQLGDQSTVVSYRGGVAPTMMNTNTNSPESFLYMKELMSQMEKLSGIFSLSRGSAPSGVRAASALRAIEEQEDKRGYSAAVKYNQIAIINNAKQTLSVAGDYYDDDDGRLAAVVGKNNEYLVRKFKTASLNKPYDIRIESSTALSKSPAGRIQEMIELQNTRFDPAAPFSREQFFSFLDFQSSDEMKDVATRAARCAESENDDLLSERFQTVQEPTPDEDLIVHWKIHMQPPQSRDFKDGSIPDEYRAALIRHALATEYLMWVKGWGNMYQIPPTPPNVLFQQRLMIECPNFPVYFTMPPMQPMMGPMGPVGGEGGPMGPGVPLENPTRDQVPPGEPLPESDPLTNQGPINE